MMIEEEEHQKTMVRERKEHKEAMDQESRECRKAEKRKREMMGLYWMDITPKEQCL